MPGSPSPAGAFVSNRLERRWNSKWSFPRHGSSSPDSPLPAQGSAVSGQRSDAHERGDLLAREAAQLELWHERRGEAARRTRGLRGPKAERATPPLNH
jgi:hypothetical protein